MLTDNNPGTFFWIGLRPPQYLPGDRRRLSVSQKDISKDIADRVPFGPAEIDMGNDSPGVAQMQQCGGDGVGDGMALATKHQKVVYDVACDVQDLVREL